MLHQEVKMKPVEIELYKIELKYSHLRTNAAKPKAGMVASFSLIGQQNPVLVILTEVCSIFSCVVTSRLVLAYL
jgi:hypothetical protein